MSARADDCHAAAAHCEDKLARVRVLLKNKNSLNIKKNIRRRQRKTFVEAGSAKETIENVEYEHFDYLSNIFVIKYFTPGVISPYLYKEIDGPLGNAKTTLITLKTCISTSCSMKMEEEIVTKPNNDNEMKEHTIPKVMDTKDENTDVKSQLISSCEDKVTHLKALLSARKKKRRMIYLNKINVESHCENISQTKEIENINTCRKQTSPPINNIVLEFTANSCSSNEENTEKQKQLQPSDFSDNLSVTVDESPDSCYISNDILSEQHSESLNDFSDLDSDGDSGRVESNLISCLNFTRTVNDLTDESLYDDNNLDVIRTFNSDSDDDTEYGLSTICEVQEDELVNSENDIKDVEPKLVSVLIDSARKLEKHNCSPKEVTFSEAPPKVHLMCVWSFAARQARIGDWMQLALDRSRFKQRIANVDMAISWVLKPQHRSRVKFQRFMPWWNAQRRQEAADKKAKEEEKLQFELEEEKIKQENIVNQESAIDNDVTDVLYKIIERIDNDLKIHEVNSTILHESTNSEALMTAIENNCVQELHSHVSLPNASALNNNVRDLIVTSLDNIDNNITPFVETVKRGNTFLPDNKSYSKDFIIKVKNIVLDTSKSDPQIVSMSYISE